MDSRVRSEGRLPAADEAPAALRRDVRLLGDTLGRVLEEAGGPELLDAVERLRRATIRLRAEPGDGNRQAVVDVVAGLELDRAAAVARAFTVYFQLVNLAEEQHRVRTLRERSRAAARQGEVVRDGLAEGVRRVRTAAAGADGGLERALDRLVVHPVLTAHPTEARRRAVVDALTRISGQVERLDDPRLSPTEEADVHRRLLEEVSVLWRTAQLRDARPTPLDEVRTVMAVFDQTFFRVAPLLYRELDEVLAPGSGARPPLARPFLRFGSWVGGDRDGNPHVTADTTLEAMEIQAEHVLRGLERAAVRVGQTLTATDRSTPPSPELLAALARDERDFPRAGRALRKRAPHEPHRRALLLIGERLAATRTGGGGGYRQPDELLTDLRLVQSSLAAAGAARLAYGELQHLIWQAETFGFHLAALEVRQHSGVHDEALDALAPGVAGDAAALSRLATEGWPAGVNVAGTAAEETVATLRAMADLQERYGPAACRRYVISMTRSAADILAVAALGRLAVPGGQLELDVVPLFESLEDLRAARGVLEELCALPAGRALVGDQFEVMLGYSDSTKDAGFLAANLALYRAQQELVAWSRAQGVDLVLFHGRGGALGRGGGPANRAVRGQAPGSVNGRFKVTEQGEAIFARYGNLHIARRHLEQVTSAVLVASSPPPEPQWEPPGALVERMAAASAAAWRTLLGTPGFAELFFRVSPLEELGALQIGSRPARRGGGRDLGSLRAIPWVFAWNQNRVILPGWYGLGTGMAAVAAEPEGLERLREMHRRWPFFTSMLENAEMSLAKADRSIAQLYLALGGELGDVGAQVTAAIEEELKRTTELVLAVTGHERLLGGRPVLRQAVDLRNPYVDALSFLQLRFLTELRGGVDDPERRARVAELVLLTVNGVAAGLQNTG